MKRKRSESSFKGVAKTDTPLRGPQKIGLVIADLMVRRGYGQAEWRDQVCQAWLETAGPQMGRLCRPGNVRRGILEVIVNSSSVLQELTFQKLSLLKKIQQQLPDAKIRDLRFRVGEVHNPEQR